MRPPESGAERLAALSGHGEAPRAGTEGEAAGERAWAAYLGAVHDAYRMAKAERAGELRGKRLSRFDSRGVHSYSWQIGYAQALGELIPEVVAEPELLGAYPLDVREAAEADALLEAIGRVVSIEAWTWTTPADVIDQWRER